MEQNKRKSCKVFELKNKESHHHVMARLYRMLYLYGIIKRVIRNIEIQSYRNVILHIPKIPCSIRGKTYYEINLYWISTKDYILWI